MRGTEHLRDWYKAIRRRSGSIWVGYVKLAQLLNFWFHGKSLDLQILKIDLQELANNLQNNGIDFKKIAILRWANFMNVWNLPIMGMINYLLYKPFGFSSIYVGRIDLERSGYK
ncbi:hypothetical protein QTP88_008857 [Uroleucon formosanum]